MNFVEDPKMLSTSFVFLREQTTLEYVSHMIKIDYATYHSISWLLWLWLFIQEFEVRGKDIGQGGGRPEKGCMVDTNNPCVLNCNGTVAVDISDVFKYPWGLLYWWPIHVWLPCKNIATSITFLVLTLLTQFMHSCTTHAMGHYVAVQKDAMGLLSAKPARIMWCMPSQNFLLDSTFPQICQTLKESTLVGYNCGQVTDVSWTLVRTHPFVFSITYGGGDGYNCDENRGNGTRYFVHCN